MPYIYDPPSYAPPAQVHEQWRGREVLVIDESPRPGFYEIELPFLDPQPGSQRNPRAHVPAYHVEWKATCRKPDQDGWPGCTLLEGHEGDCYDPLRDGS